MEICELCKTKLVDFYHFKKRSEQVRQIKSSCMSTKSQYLDDQVEDKSVYSIVQIVRDYISKHSVVEIREDESEGQLVVMSTCHRKQLNRDPSHDQEESKDYKLEMGSDDLDETYVDDIDVKPDALEPEYLEEEDYLPTDDSMKELIEENDETDYDVVEIDGEDDELNDCEESDDFSYTNQQSASESANDLSKSVNPRRMRHPENWACNKRKTLRNSGQSYRNSKGKTVDAKQMRESCGESCRSKCVTKISEADRQRAFEHYWGLGDVVKQRKFVYKHITSAEPKRRRAVNSSRSVTLQFYLEASVDEGVHQLVQVCKKMFKNTLVISSQVIQGVVKKYAIEGFNDTRGKFERKLTEAQKFAVEHVKKFPFFYIEQVLTKVDCYNMYRQECSKLNLDPVKEGNYRDIFDKQNQGSFLKTMKVACEMCHRYYRGTDEERAALQKEHDIHISLGVNKKCRDRALGRLRHKRAQERKKLERIAATIDKTSTPG